VPTDADERMGSGRAIVQSIRDALGVEDGKTLVVQTPQFERQDGIEPGQPPLTHDAMDRLTEADKETLKELGLRKWSDETGLWLLPHEWHPHVPPEYPVMDILNEWTTRSEKPATPDKRFGVLSFGIVPEFEKEDSDDGE